MQLLNNNSASGKGSPMCARKHWTKERAFAERKKLLVRRRVAPVCRTPAAGPSGVAPDLQGRIADPNQESLEREQRIRERVTERQRRMEELQRTRTPAVRPQATTPSADEPNSVSPSPTPE